MNKVLIADDKASSRELVRTVLERCGYSVYEAGDGLEAVMRSCEVQPDLIILDLHMPGLDGYGAVQQLRGQERFRYTPMMALTANAMHGERERALEAGFTSYISKPIGLAALRAEVNRLLQDRAPEVQPGASLGG